MNRKATSVLCLLAGCAASASAQWIHWNGGGANNLWQTAANWSDGEVPNGLENLWVDNGTPPIRVDRNSEAAATGINLGWSVNGMAAMQLETNGLLMVRNAVMTGQDKGPGRLLLLEGDLIADRLLAGAAVAGTTNYARTVHPGEVVVDGGIVRTRALVAGNGTIRINGGMIFLKNTAVPNGLPDHFELEVLDGGQIRIGGGELAITGDQTDSHAGIHGLIAAGKIVPDNPADTLVVNYHEGRTRVFCRGAAASEPFPVYGEVSAECTNTVLGWTAAPVASEQRIYLHTDLEKVGGRDAAALAATLSGGAVLLDTGPLAGTEDYYWAVDATVGGTNVPGPLWRFTTTDLPPVADTNIGFHVQGGVVCKDGLPWRGFGLTFHFTQRRDERQWTGEIGKMEEQLRPMFAHIASYGIPFFRSWLHPDDVYYVQKKRFLAERDALLDLALEYGFGMVPQIGWYIPTLLEHSGETHADLLDAGSVSHKLVRTYVRDIVTRYLNHPLVWGYEMTGDVGYGGVDVPGSPIELEMYQSLDETFSSAVRAWDKHRMVEQGCAAPRIHAWHLWQGRGWVEDTPEQWYSMVAMQNGAQYDTISYHPYYGSIADRRLERGRIAARRLGMPVYAGEFGGTNAAQLAELTGKLELHDILMGTLFAYGSGDPWYSIGIGSNEDYLVELQSLNQRMQDKIFQASPAHMDHGVATNAVLGWLAGTNAQSFNVWFGSDGTAVSNRAASVFRGAQAGTTFNPGGLTRASRYYWAVDVMTPDGLAEGLVRSFETDGLFFFHAEDDATVRSSLPDANYETWAVLYLSGSASGRGYVRFDVAGISGKKIWNSKVRFQAQANSAAAPFTLYRVCGDWNAATITWNNAPSLGEVVGTVWAEPGAYAEFDVSGIVTNDGSYSFAVMNHAAGFARLHAAEGALDSKPVIRVVAGAAGDAARSGTPVAWLAGLGYGKDFDLAELLDPDGDEFANWQEFVAGTQPNDPASRLLLQGGFAAGVPELSFATATGRIYSVYSRSNLVHGAWRLLKTVEGIGRTETCVDDGQAPAAFYRLEAALPSREGNR